MHKILPPIGSQTECQYNLMKSGLPAKELPLTDTGELKNSNHLQWLEKRRAKERALS
jgi:hypothetical protein